MAKPKNVVLKFKVLDEMRFTTFATAATYAEYLVNKGFIVHMTVDPGVDPELYSPAIGYLVTRYEKI